MTRRISRIMSEVLAFLTILCVSFNGPCFGLEDQSKYPSKPITLIVHFGVGGGIDLTARKLSELAGKTLHRPVVLVNKSGGAGIIGNTALAKADPDGYTIGTVSYSIPITPHIRQLPYNVNEDFTYIMTYAEFSEIFFCVQGSSPAKSFKEFIEESRRHPGKLNYSTPGPLGSQHILMEYIFSTEKVRLNHVPVSGSAECVTKLLGGHLDAGISTDMTPHMRSGKLRALALQSSKRHRDFPDVPTFLELGYKVEAPLWLGLAGPKGLDPVILAKINNAFKLAYDDPGFPELCNTLGFMPIYRNPEAFKELVLRDYVTQGKLLKELNLTK